MASSGAIVFDRISKQSGGNSSEVRALPDPVHFDVVLCAVVDKRIAFHTHMVKSK